MEINSQRTSDRNLTLISYVRRNIQLNQCNKNMHIIIFFWLDKEKTILYATRIFPIFTSLNLSWSRKHSQSNGERYKRIQFPQQQQLFTLPTTFFFFLFFFILNVETSLSSKAERNLSGGSFAALILQIHRGHSFLAYFHLTRIASRDRSRPTKWKSYISRDETSSVFTSTGDPLILYDYDFQR